MLDLPKHLQVIGKALDLRVQRHQVLASNIANADTPNYKARDFDFTATMANALSGRGQGLALDVTSPGHRAGAVSNLAPNLAYRAETQSAVDGNTVDMDVERAQIAENALQHQILTNMIAESVKSMRLAISSNQG